MNHGFTPGQSIESSAGLYEAAWDVITDELPKRFFIAQLLARLPYEQRTRNAVDRLVRNGYLKRIGLGYYEQ